MPWWKRIVTYSLQTISIQLFTKEWTYLFQIAEKKQNFLMPWWKIRKRIVYRFISEHFHRAVHIRLHIGWHSSINILHVNIGILLLYWEWICCKQLKRKRIIECCNYKKENCYRFRAFLHHHSQKTLFYAVLGGNLMNSYPCTPTWGLAPLWENPGSATDVYHRVGKMDWNCTKRTGNAHSISAAASCVQILREPNFPQVKISFVISPFPPEMWMYLC